MARVPKNPRCHCYFGCDEGGPLHHFPKPESDTERFELWKAILDSDTKQKGDMYIYNQLRLCNNHFEFIYHSPPKRLTRNAVPTIHTGKADDWRKVVERTKKICVQDWDRDVEYDNIIDQPLIINVTDSCSSDSDFEDPLDPVSDSA